MGGGGQRGEMGTFVLASIKIKGKKICSPLKIVSRFGGDVTAVKREK